jgi:predicted Zn-dependent protease with MMP-like domain
VSPREFDDLVERAFAVVAPRFRRLISNVVFVVEPEPPRPGLLGLYEGRPLTERSVADSLRFPDKITIYQGPHERAARSRAALERLVAETIWHEVAHHFGMNESQVLRAESRRARRRERERR